MWFYINSNVKSFQILKRNCFFLKFLQCSKVWTKYTSCPQKNVFKKDRWSVKVLSLSFLNGMKQKPFVILAKVLLIKSCSAVIILNIIWLPHQPKFSDFFDLCLHSVSVVRALEERKKYTLWNSDSLKFSHVWCCQTLQDEMIA